MQYFFQAATCTLLNYCQGQTILVFVPDFWFVVLNRVLLESIAVVPVCSFDLFLELGCLFYELFYG